jgi:hypothetical protein
VKTNSLPRYANKEEIDLAYETASEYLRRLEGLHSTLEGWDPEEVTLWDQVTECFDCAEAMNEIGDSLRSRFKALSENHRFAHVALVPLVQDQYQETCFLDCQDRDLYYDGIHRLWKRFLRAAITWTYGSDRDELLEREHKYDSDRFGPDLMGFFGPSDFSSIVSDPHIKCGLREKLDPEKVIKIRRAMDGFRKEVYFDLEKERILFRRLRARCKLEHSQLIRDLPSLPGREAPPSGTRKGIGGRPRKGIKKESNRELLISILLKHHRYNLPDKDLNTDPISTEDACKQLGWGKAVLSKAWPAIKEGLTYRKYELICGNYRSVKAFLEAIDSKEGYLERTNNEDAIGYAED